MNVRVSSIAASAGVAATLLAGALPASAQTGAPIQIKSCTVNQYAPPQPAFRRYYWYDYGYAGPNVPYGSPYTDGIRISFVNTGSKTADRVVFGVDYRGDFERVIDAGTFSPTVTIDHTFGDVFSGYAYIGPKPNSCVVRVVRFQDGSVWRAPGLLPRRQQR